MPIAKNKTDRLFIVRHGESTGNVDPEQYKKLLQRVPLTARGWQQALACGDFLAAFLEAGGDLTQRRIALWHSSYTRARQTAKGIFAAIERFDPYVFERDTIVEISFGYATGMSDEEASKAFPHYGEHLVSSKQQRTKHFLESPNGESRADVGLKARIFFDSVHRKTAEFGITDHIFVSHGSTSRIIAKEWLNLPYEVTDAESNPDNCDVRMIARDAQDTHYQDYGYIYASGHARETKPVRYSSALERLRSDIYTPDFAHP
jgi:broad specificity phosphatase PhoE